MCTFREPGKINTPSAAKPLAVHVDRIVLFDGVCNLCSAAVQFIVKRDRQLKFHFATLQSDDGSLLLKRYAMNENHANEDHTSKYGSLVLIEGGRVYSKSDAALRIAHQLRFPWPLCDGFVIIPRDLRNIIYDFVAKHRYRWFGRRAVCRRPKPSEVERFQIWKS